MLSYIIRSRALEEDRANQWQDLRLWGGHVSDLLVVLKGTTCKRVSHMLTLYENKRQDSDEVSVLLRSFWEVEASGTLKDAQILNFDEKLALEKS